MVAQVSVFLQSILHNDRRRLHGDETLFYQPGHITFDGALAFANGFPNRFVAGPALMSLTVFQP